MHIGFDATALPNLPVGAGNYIIQLARALAQQPDIDRLTVFVQRRRQALMGLDTAVPDRVQLVPVADLPVGPRLLWEQIALPRLVKSLGIELLHSPHYTQPLAPPCRSVVTFHDMTFLLFPHLHTRPKRLLFPGYIRHSARRADALIADSESTRQDAMRLLHIPPEKITAIPLGVRAEFRPVHDVEAQNLLRQRYALPEKFILYVGALEPRKNLPVLLDAFRRAAANLPGYHLVLAGRLGWHYQAILEQMKGPGLRERVRHIGYVSDSHMPTLYSLASVFVYPSAYEGFGLPVLEALACGVPVVSTRVSSIPEIAGEAAILLPPGDVPALEQALVALADDDHRQELARRGPARAALFSWERCARETIQIYRHILIPGR